MSTLAVPDRNGGLEGAADRVLEPMLRDSEGEDDVCLLLCHVDGETAENAGTAGEPPVP
jgi:hypothetical protein